MQEVTLYSDGSSRGNPVRVSSGAFCSFATGRVSSMSSSYRAVLRARRTTTWSYGVITGLEALKRPCRVEVHSDSRYVVNAFNQHWVEGWLNARMAQRRQTAREKRRFVEKAPCREGASRGDVSLGEGTCWASRERALRSAGHCGGGYSRSTGGRGVRRGVAFRARSMLRGSLRRPFAELAQVAAIIARDDALLAIGEEVRVQPHEVAIGHRRQVVDDDLIRIGFQIRCGVYRS